MLLGLGATPSALLRVPLGPNSAPAAQAAQHYVWHVGMPLSTFKAGLFGSWSLQQIRQNEFIRLGAGACDS